MDHKSEDSGLTSILQTLTTERVDSLTPFLHGIISLVRNKGRVITDNVRKRRRT